MVTSVDNLAINFEVYKSAEYKSKWACVALNRLMWPRMVLLHFTAMATFDLALPCVGYCRGLFMAFLWPYVALYGLSW